MGRGINPWIWNSGYEPGGVTGCELVVSEIRGYNYMGCTGGVSGYEVK